ncbi:MAG: secretin and TonB N-terminal domain-containing protein [Nitrospirae bacterium]|nr:secretin and TonB N-terminal domain-containing protein [Nitrospirota bacterium]
MDYDRPKLGFVARITIVLIILTMYGCQTQLKKDSEIEKWSKHAETSRGYTPSKKPSLHNETIAIRKDNDTPAMRMIKKELPKTPVKLKVRNAEIKAVLRAMAASEGINVLVKDNVVGSVTVDFSNTNWDTVFKSILKSYGLVYVWEEDIIRIVKQEDL